MTTIDTSCPACSYHFDAHSSLTGDSDPVADDFSICINCSALLVFEADLSLRLAGPDEILIAESIPDIAELRRLIRSIGGKR